MYFHYFKGNSVKQNVTLEKLDYSKLSSQKQEEDEASSDTANLILGKQDNSFFFSLSKAYLKYCSPFFKIFLFSGALMFTPK